MNRPMRKRIGVVVLFALPAALLLAKEKKTKPGERGEPFYRSYLNSADPLDQKILEQERRVEADPKSAALRNDFGNLLAARRFSKEAREQYEIALELDPRHFLAAYNLGLLWESEGKLGRAMSAYRKAIARKPGFPPAHFRLGRLYEKRGWNGLAVGEYAKALRIDPAMRDPRQNPLVVDSRLLARASLENYSRDLASASLKAEAGYAEPWRFRSAPVDRPVSSDDIADPSAPEPIETRLTTTPRPGLRAPGAPGSAVRQIPQVQPAAPPPPEPIIEPPEEEQIPPEEMPHPPPFVPTRAPGR